MEHTIVKTEYFWNLCPAVGDLGIPVIIGITVVITLRLTFNFVIYLMNRKKSKDHKLDK